MLDNLSCSYEIILLLKHSLVTGVVKIVLAHFKPSFLQHHRKCGSRTTTKIQAARAQRKSLNQRVEQPTQKSPVTFIVNPILMQIIFRSFSGGSYPLSFGHEDQFATLALQVRTPLIFVIQAWPLRSAQGAGLAFKIRYWRYCLDSLISCFSS